MSLFSLFPMLIFYPWEVWAQSRFNINQGRPFGEFRFIHSSTLPVKSEFGTPEILAVGFSEGPSLLVTRFRDEMLLYFYSTICTVFYLLTRVGSFCSGLLKC